MMVMMMMMVNHSKCANPTVCANVNKQAQASGSGDGEVEVQIRKCTGRRAQLVAAHRKRACDDVPKSGAFWH